MSIVGRLSISRRVLYRGYTEIDCFTRKTKLFSVLVQAVAGLASEPRKAKYPFFSVFKLLLLAVASETRNLKYSQAVAVAKKSKVLSSVCWFKLLL